MANTNQEQLWKAIQRDAKAAKLTDGEYLSKNPERYAAYQQAAAKQSPLHNNAAQRAISEEARETAKSRGISEAAALVDIFGRDQEGRARYDQWRAERDKRLSPKSYGGGADGGGVGPLSIAEKLALQAQALRLGYTLTIADIEDSGFVASRALMADLSNEASDMSDADSESYGEIVRFSDLDHLP